MGEFIPKAQVIIIQSGEGHDGFLLEFDQMKALLNEFIQKNAPHLVKPVVEQDEPIVVTKNSIFGEAEDILLW